MVYFDNCDVIVNGSGLLADSASLNIDNSLIPIYVLGKKGIVNQSPNGPLRSTFQFSYIPEVSNEPNYNCTQIINQLLNDIYYSGVSLEIGGIIGTNCYLQSYSLKATPNNLIKVAASYISFTPTFGQIKNKTSGIIYDLTNTLGHGWTTYVLSTGDFLSVPTYEFAYDFKANWEPIYTIGNPYPIQVKLLEGEEKITIVRDTSYNIDFSGNNACNQLFSCSTNDQSIDVMSVSLLCQSNFSTGNATIIPSQNNFSGIIVDNPQAVFVGSWIVATSSSQKFGTYYTVSACVTGNATSMVTYSPYIQNAGYYNVYITYVDGQSRSTGTPIFINYSGTGLLGINLNQTISGGIWQLIGQNLPFDTGISGNVQMFNDTNETGKVIVADAFLWMPVLSSGIFPPFITGIINTGTQTTSTIQLSCNSLQFSVSGAKLKSSQVNATLDDIVRTTTTIYKYF